MKYSFSLLLLIFCLAFPTKSFGQESPKEGYIIKNNGERLEGWLFKTNGDEKYRSVTFSKEGYSKRTTFYFDQIKEYGIGDRVKFLSAANFPEASNPYIDSTFLMVLVSGKLSLLQGIGPLFILMDSTNRLVPLSNAELEQQDVKGFTTAVYQEERRINTGVMVQLMQDCLPVAMKISNGEYQFEQNSKMLADIVLDYNQCQNSEHVNYLAKRKKIAFAVQVASGVNRYKPWYRDEREIVAVEDGPYISRYPYEYTQNLVLSAGGEIWFPSILDELSIQFRVATAEYSYGGSYYGPVFSGSDDSVSSFLDIDYRTLDLSIGLRYSFLPSSRVAPYIIFGGILRQHDTRTYEFHTVRFDTDKPEIVNDSRSAPDENGIYYGIGATIPTPRSLPIRLSVEYKAQTTSIPTTGEKAPLSAQSLREHGLHLVLSSRPF